jgi:hypothetical protein
MISRFARSIQPRQAVGMNREGHDSQFVPQCQQMDAA